MSETYNPEGRRRPGRPSNAEIVEREATPRQEETQQRRRRREGLGPERNLKLHVPENMKDPNFEYRWANDRRGRIHNLTVDDDWDIAPEMKGEGLGTVTERTVDSGIGEKAILLRKLKKYYDEDQAAKEELLKARDASMRRGPLPDPEGAGAGEGEKTYVPGGRNTINGR